MAFQYLLTPDRMKLDHGKQMDSWAEILKRVHTNIMRQAFLVGLTFIPTGQFSINQLYDTN